VSLNLVPLDISKDPMKETLLSSTFTSISATFKDKSVSFSLECSSDKTLDSINAKKTPLRVVNLSGSFDSHTV